MSEEEEERAHEATIESLTSRLKARYPQLMVHPSVCPQDETPFVHMWKLSPANTEMKYLPCFHAVVTLDDGEVNVSLFTYHGKLVACVAVDASADMDKPVKILEQVANDEILVCQGVADVKEPGEGLRGPVLYESFGQNRVVARSRACQFAVFDSSSSDKPQCFSCQTLAKEERSFLKEEQPENGAANESAVECQVLQLLLTKTGWPAPQNRINNPLRHIPST